MRIILFLSLVSPFCIFSGESENYLNEVSFFINNGNIPECLRVISDWEITSPQDQHQIDGIKGSVYISIGDLEGGMGLMAKFIEDLSVEERNDPLINSMIGCYYNGVAVGLTLNTDGMNNYQQCRYKQPTGVKVRYWCGLGQVLTGMLVTPFNPAAGSALIASGSAMLFDASCDALDNKDRWKRELQERQRTNPDYQMNSFFGGKDQLNPIFSQI